MSFGRGGQRQILPFGLDWADIKQNATEDLEFPIPINGQPTDIEKECYQQFTYLTSTMKDSSFYTGNLKSLSQNLNSNKKKSIIYLEGGVNDGLKRYSDKYRKQIKIGKSINDHPFILSFFPSELHSVMISKSGKKSLNVSKYKKGSKNGTDIDKIIKNAEERQKEILERLNEVAANAHDDDAEEDDNQDEEENFDDEFEDEDDDDYNAEKYFDDGDDFDEGGDDGDDEAAF